MLDYIPPPSITRPSNRLQMPGFLGDINLFSLVDLKWAQFFRSWQTSYRLLDFTMNTTEQTSEGNDLGGWFKKQKLIQMYYRHLNFANHITASATPWKITAGFGQADKNFNRGRVYICAC